MGERHNHAIILSEFPSLLEEFTQVDMECYASDFAVDYMQAYYKVSLGTSSNGIGSLGLPIATLLRSG
jgi:hypothetical protein